MTKKTLLTAIVLTLAPAMAYASCNYGEHSAQTTSCKAGTSWDAASNSCVTDPLG